MKLIANRQLTGDYGTVSNGEPFDVADDRTAKELVSRGLARQYEVPRIVYETKVINPEAPEVSARQPFHDVLVHHEEQTEVVAEGDPVLPESDVRQPGVADSGGRRGRGRFSSGR